MTDEQEAKIKKLKLDKKLLLKSHKAEIRWRDRKEVAALLMFCGLVMLYAYVELFSNYV